MSEQGDAENRAAGQPADQGGVDEAAIIADYKEHFLEILAERIKTDEEFAEKGFRARYDSPDYGDGSDMVDTGRPVHAEMPPVPQKPYTINSPDYGGGSDMADTGRPLYAVMPPGPEEPYRIDSPRTDLFGSDYLRVERTESGPRISRKKRRTRKKALLALAALFVFLIGGTLLTRRNLSGTNKPYIPDEQVIPENHKNGDGAEDDKDIPGMQDVNPDSSHYSGTDSFFGDMWLFVKTAAPYLLCFASGALLGACYVKRKGAE